MTMLPLNAFLLRSFLTPANAWTDAAQEDVQLYYWTNGAIEALSADEADILDAAVEGDIILAILRRVSSAPPWQKFIKDALISPISAALARRWELSYLCRFLK